MDGLRIYLLTYFWHLCLDKRLDLRICTKLAYINLCWKLVISSIFLLVCFHGSWCLNFYSYSNSVQIMYLFQDCHSSLRIWPHYFWLLGCIVVLLWSMTSIQFWIQLHLQLLFLLFTWFGSNWGQHICWTKTTLPCTMW